MALVGGVIVALGFIGLIKLFGLVEKNIRVIEIAKSAVLIVRDANLDDYQKEIALQKYAKTLLSLFFLITTTTILAIAIPFGVIWLMELANLLSVKEVIDMITSLEFVIATVIISIILVAISLKKK
ncbi:hypothetical protein ACFLXI_08105 [Chloroflexota bacterium]